jgi:hypothetical protein
MVVLGVRVSGCQESIAELGSQPKRKVLDWRKLGMQRSGNASAADGCAAFRKLESSVLQPRNRERHSSIIARFGRKKSRSCIRTKYVAVRGLRLKWSRRKQQALLRDLLLWRTAPHVVAFVTGSLRWLTFPVAF